MVIPPANHRFRLKCGKNQQNMEEKRKPDEKSEKYFHVISNESAFLDLPTAVPGTMARTVAIIEASSLLLLQEKKYEKEKKAKRKLKSGPEVPLICAIYKQPNQTKSEPNQNE